jgi:plastocyanin
MKANIAFGLCLLASFCLPRAGHAQATIQGTVELPKNHSTPVMNKRYEVIAKGGVLSIYPPLAVVYLEGSFPKPAVLPTAQMSQKDLEFQPGLLAVQTGTKVEFPNFDPTYHDVFSFSAPKRFDLGRYRPDAKPVPSEIFDMPGLVTVRCDIHEHMRALILVLDTPYFAVTDAQGNYRLNDVPAGHYTLRAWVDSRTTLKHPVDLTAEGALRVNFP